MNNIIYCFGIPVAMLAEASARFGNFDAGMGGAVAVGSTEDRVWRVYRQWSREWRQELEKRLAHWVERLQMQAEDWRVILAGEPIPLTRSLLWSPSDRSQQPAV